MDVPLPIRKALLIDGKNKTVNYLIHGKYELTNTSWSKLQEKYHVSKDKVYTTVKGKKRPRVSQYWQKSKVKKQTKAETTVSAVLQESLD